MKKPRMGGWNQHREPKRMDGTNVEIQGWMEPTWRAHGWMDGTHMENSRRDGTNMENARMDGWNQKGEPTDGWNQCEEPRMDGTNVENLSQMDPAWRRTTDG